MLTYSSSYKVTPLPHLTPRWRPVSPRGYRPQIRPYLWVRGIALYVYLPLFFSILPSFLSSKMVRTPTCENAQSTPPAFFLFLSLFFLLLFSLFPIFLNWRIIALQYCVGLCHPSVWISHRHTYVSSPWAPLPISIPRPTPLGCHRAPGWAGCVTQQIPTCSLFYIW